MAEDKIYYVENIVRKEATRLHRAKSPTRHRYKQFVAGRRILRTQKLALTEEEFQAHKDQIKEMVLAGVVALHMPDGMKVTSTIDRRLVYRRADGAVKVDEKAVPVKGTEPAVAPAPPPVAAPPPPVVVKTAAPPPPVPKPIVPDPMVDIVEDDDSGEETSESPYKKRGRRK